MPTTPIHLPFLSLSKDGIESPLPSLLRTPSGVAILELQGTVNLPSSTTETSSEIGNIVFPDLGTSVSSGTNLDEIKRVWMYIGKHQKLTGEVKKLAKPLGVLRKIPGQVDGGEELEIVDIIRYKILFSQRPEPVT